MAVQTPASLDELPAVDERLVAPESGYEIIDGKLVLVPPADKPHGERHGDVNLLVRTHRADGYSVAIDLLTRTSKTDDIAPDVSLYPTDPDPKTGGRQIEVMAFEVVSTESMKQATAKARKLATRGVRRVFAIQLSKVRVLEWSLQLDDWMVLDPKDHIDDPALAVPLPIAALLGVERAEDAAARALRSRRDDEFLAERAEGRAEGKAEGRAQGKAEGRAQGKAEGLAEGLVKGRIEEGLKAVVTVLAARGVIAREDEKQQILDERDLSRIERWLVAAATCGSIAELLAIR